uniref:Uncharacterized protein n=1 Tax=Timema genevievae TaxID=629358 RepID=A0A7R9PNH4_TIMGE|nr:unnamed protein product [Timema genevievae]
MLFENGYEINWSEAIFKVIIVLRQPFVNRKHNDIPIYNFVGGNILSFSEAHKICSERILEIPTTKSIWYPWMRTFQSIFLYRLLAIFVHVIPAVLLDTVLRIMGKPPM